MDIEDAVVIIKPDGTWVENQNVNLEDGERRFIDMRAFLGEYVSNDPDLARRVFSYMLSSSPLDYNDLNQLLVDLSVHCQRHQILLLTSRQEDNQT